LSYATVQFLRCKYAQIDGYYKMSVKLNLYMGWLL